MNRLHLSIIAISSSLLILPTTVFATAIPIASNPQSIQLASNLSVAQIRQLAQAITVKVLANRELGSGILIAKQGTNYTVLTNAHVLNAKGKYRIQTPDGKIHSAVVINKGSSLQGNDLAVLQFSAKQTYRIVALATATTKAENQSVYAAGFAIDSQQLLITTGKISLIAPKPLAGGYQLGYTNQIKQGMSGGPLLNQSGELIGVNGLLNNAILNDTYTYLDGSSPTNELRQQLRQLSFAVPIATLAQLPTQEAVIPDQERNQNPQPIPPVPKQPALTGVAGELDLIAQQITLRIDAKDQNNGNGSGVIIAHQGQTYYVLTASHVVEKPDQYTVVTPDGQKHGINGNDIIREEGLDVAIIKFNSQKEYTVATLAIYNLSDRKKHWVFLSGFPGSAVGKRQFSPGVRFDENEGFFQTKDTATNLSKGYELVFSNLSLPGMSGGPLLDTGGRVIGIGGRQEGEEVINQAEKRVELQLGFALGVPIRTGLDLAAKAGIKPQWMKLETSSPGTIINLKVSSIFNHLSFNLAKPALNADETEWLNYGSLLWRLGRYDEAVAALQQATAKKPNFYQAYYVLGLARQSQGKYPEAVATFKQVVGINEDYYQAWREQSDTLVLLKKYPEALAAIDKAIKINSQQASADDPQDFIQYVKKGYVLYALKRYAEAEIALDEAINIKPSAIAYNTRGVFRSEQKNYPGAEADYNQAIRINPKYAEAYLNRGSLRQKQQNYLGAEADYNQAIDINPKYAEAYNNQGVLRYDQENYPSAEANYHQAIRLNPELVQAYLNRGLLRSELQNYPGAEADFNQAIRLNPQYAEAYHNRGLLRQKQQNYPGAEADFTQAIRISPGLVHAYNARGFLRYQLKNYPGAEADFTQAIRISSEDAEAYNNRGYLRREGKNYLGAEADYSQAIRIDPENEEAYINRYYVRKEVRNYVGAEADFMQAIKINPELVSPENYPVAEVTFNQAIKDNPNNARAYYNRGVLCYNKKNYSEAETDFTQAIILNPRLTYAYSYRGNLRTELKNYSGAETDFTQLIQSDPNNADAYHNRGYARVELKNYSGAEADFTQAIILKPKFTIAYNDRGNLRYKLKNFSGAEADFTQAIIINPEFAGTYNDRGHLRYNLKNYQGAIADFQIAAQLYRKYKDIEGYQKAQKFLNILQTLPK